MLPTDGEPFILLAHSLGTTISYEVLLNHAPANLNVDQYITIGCPNGLSVVQAELRRLNNIPTGRLPVPSCVRKWNNYSDALDPVALVHNIDTLFSPDLFIYDELVHNPCSPQAPHNILGYLRVPDIRNLVFTSMDLL